MTTPPAPETPIALPATDLMAQDRFVLRQKITLGINRYFFTLPGPDGEEDPNQPVAFVEQARFKFKEDIRFFTNESKATEILRIKARQRFDPRAKYDITDGHDQRIGLIQKVFGKSLLRSTYAVYDANDELLFTARERSMLVALLRRAVGFVPMVGDLADWLPIPYHFDFFRGEGDSGERIGTNSRKFGSFRDVYKIDVSEDTGRTIDRRLFLALAVGQDALQAR